MNTVPRLLVVDDEEVVCQSCTRILESEGFRVETSTDSAEGLRLASRSEYAAILLDIMLPGMDGLEFLERLRLKNATVPVIIITGYSAVPTAAAAMRLGAADYIPKPFTPSEITAAVKRIFHRAAMKDTSVSAPMSESRAWVALSGDFLFMDETWFQLGRNGSARVGALLSREVYGDENATILMPRVGDEVRRGLPLAALVCSGKVSRVIPSPLTGEIMEINPALAESTAALWENPCQEGWIACIRPLQLQEDTEACRMRNVVLANPDDIRSFKQQRLLSRLGCRVFSTTSVEETLVCLHRTEARMLVLDAATLADQGLILARNVNEDMPQVKVVVVAAPSTHLEAAYREQRILYYALEPVTDSEIIDILYSAFRTTRQSNRKTTCPVDYPRWIRRIRIVNRLGEWISLLISCGAAENEGLGQSLIRTVLDGAYPVTVNLGYKAVDPVRILQETSVSDRTVVLLQKDMGRIPGTLVREAREHACEMARLAKGSSRDVVNLYIQPPSPEATALAFDERLNEALAEHIVKEMTDPNRVDR